MKTFNGSYLGKKLFKIKNQKLGGLARLSEMFYPTFISNLVSQFNQKVCYVAGKRLFDQVVFTINSDVKPSCRTNVLILFN